MEIAESNITSLKFIRPCLAIVPIITAAARIHIRKRKNLKRNLCPAAEPNQVIHLRQSAQKISRHRTRPIQNHDHTVISRTRQSSHLTKQVFIILVSMKLTHIQSTSFRSRRPSILIGSLLHLKFFDHVSNSLLGIILESFNFLTSLIPIKSIGRFFIIIV